MKGFGEEGGFPGAERVQRLRKLRDELARPGACDRAAAFLVEAVRGRTTKREAA